MPLYTIRVSKVLFVGTAAFQPPMGDWKVAVPGTAAALRRHDDRAVAPVAFFVRASLAAEVR